MSAESDIFRREAGDFAARTEQRGFIRGALRGYEQTRARTAGAFANYDAAREAARRVKWEALHQLPDLLARFADRLEARGGKVFWAGNGAEAVDYIRAVARRRKARLVVKSRGWTSTPMVARGGGEGEAPHTRRGGGGGLSVGGGAGRSASGTQRTHGAWGWATWGRTARRRGWCRGCRSSTMPPWPAWARIAAGR